MTTCDIGKPHLRRLRDIWRSAGWPCHDVLEAELVAAGLLERMRDAEGRETVRVSDAGVQAIAASVQAHRGARDAHEQLVAQVATAMQRAGRLTWQRLSLRAQVAGAWVMSQPDVFSIRQTTVEAYAEPVVHEIKVRRADLLSDLRQPAKGAAYLATACQCWYVLKAGIGGPEDIPEAFGVLIADAGRLDVARVAPHRPMTVAFATWMALARANADVADLHAQSWLCADETPGPSAD
ncbi:hypothetical protein V4F39_24355 [Aquincola sp. MAHUQ-54]|uniref:PD-(D/E)XK nuclease superfamily protein n=1 Tax=Aquincola agrisoli TaxID=3119538 RepID=A0AAW9QAR3_9BURK